MKRFRFRNSFKSILLFLAGVATIGQTSVSLLYAQAPITSSGLGTEVSAPVDISEGKVQYDITGGTRPGGGLNLFHSFSTFDVPSKNIANFLNGVSLDHNGALLPPGLPTANILARVTGPNPSAIFGTIQTSGFDNANLFLMNPNGIVFGPNASLQVAGSVTFTTANNLRLADNALFNASPSTSTDALLSAAPVAAFGFVESNAVALTIQGSTLKASRGQTLSLVGGNQTFTTMDPDTNNPIFVSGGVTITDGKLSAQSGQINLVSVGGPGEVLMNNFEPIQSMALGTINLSQGTVIKVSGNTGGTVRIRGGNLVVDSSTIAADSINANGASMAIDIKVTENVSFSTVDRPALTARTTGIGSAGEIQISSGSMDVTATAQDSLIFSVIDTHTSSSGKAGSVGVRTGDLTVTGEILGGLPVFVDSGIIGNNGGHGGDINVMARTFNAQDTVINSGNAVGFEQEIPSTGQAGNIAISADSLQLINVGVIADAFLTNPSIVQLRNLTAQSGNIVITSPKIDLADSFITTFGLQRGGALAIKTDHFVASNSPLSAQTGLLDGGGITIEGRVIELTDGSSVTSSTAGDGNAGPISISAKDHLALLRTNPTDRQTGIFSNSFGTRGNLGDSGAVTITTPRLDMTGGARINTSSATSGHGGNVTITANEIRMSGESGDLTPEPLFSLGTIQPSGIFTLSVGGKCSGICGNAGNISITTDSLSMGTGSQINSGTSNTGQGGTITITARDSMVMSGTISTGQPGGIQSRTIGTTSDAGPSGNITLTAGQSVTIQDGASVSASSTGPGDAGNISVDAGQRLNVESSKITTEANQSKAGNINIQAIDQVRVVNGEISTSVRSGAGRGGDITIDPKTVILQDSTKVFAQAVQGSGGNITITTPLYLKDATSRVNADSQFGLNGSVTIQSPTSNLSGTVGQLTAKTSPPQVLLQNRCIALAGGEQSTFILAGRDALPSEPGGWLSSPVAMEHWTGEVPEEHVSRLMVQNRGWNRQPPLVMSKDETTVLSLRRLTPPGFLIRTFATDTTGCPA